jgi:hypothetical protein
VFIFAVLIEGTNEAIVVAAPNNIQARRAAARLRPDAKISRAFRLLTSHDHDHV